MYSPQCPCSLFLITVMPRYPNHHLAANSPGWLPPRRRARTRPPLHRSAGRGLPVHLAPAGASLAHETQRGGGVCGCKSGGIAIGLRCCTPLRAGGLEGRRRGTETGSSTMDGLGMPVRSRCARTGVGIADGWNARAPCARRDRHAWLLAGLHAHPRERRQTPPGAPQMW
jgi:hypothetical protein